MTKHKKRVSRKAWAKQMKMGTKVEYEHLRTYKKYKPKTKLYNFAKSIARDHMNEHPDYYYKHKKAGL